MIFFLIFLLCCEKAHDDKEFSLENSKPHHESRITTCKAEPCALCYLYTIGKVHIIPGKTQNGMKNSLSVSQYSI